MEIKKYLKEILSSQELVNQLPDKRVFFLHAKAPDKTLYVEYEILGEYGEFHDENEETFTGYLVQVDIFSTGDYSKIENIIKKLMLKNGFVRDRAADLYEGDTGLYHKAMRFSIALESERMM